ncbi:unnamed protein product [Cuscuta europaea]|uniref:Uncharacterized protein n=1 Tax=Cuscuta europaea TaxID=41803 RepID=A0A9P1E8P0_CUSEU|nr:unnamed protein product [Cuscuta europaea]
MELMLQVMARVAALEWGWKDEVARSRGGTDMRQGQEQGRGIWLGLEIVAGREGESCKIGESGEWREGLRGGGGLRRGFGDGEGRMGVVTAVVSDCAGLDVVGIGQTEAWVGVRWFNGRANRANHWPGEGGDSHGTGVALTRRRCR